MAAPRHFLHHPCAAGVVTADATYNSAVGVGFNLNQSTAGGTPGSVAAPSSISVTTVTSGAGAGNAAMRVQITSASGANYCVEAGTWASGTPIPIGNFNTTCWNGWGTSLSAGTGITSINLVVPSDAVADRPFSFRLTGATLDPSFPN